MTKARSVSTGAAAKGDIVVGTGTNTSATLSVGTDYLVLQTLASATTGTQWAGATISYTPTWTSTGTAPAIGNGSLGGEYVRIGKMCIVMIYFTGGSTSTFGSGNYNFSLPFTASAPGGAQYGIPGGFYVEDYGVAGYRFGAALASTTTIQLCYYNNQIFGANIPFTFGVNDYFKGSFIYEVA